MLKAIPESTTNNQRTNLLVQLSGLEYREAELLAGLILDHCPHLIEEDYMRMLSRSTCRLSFNLPISKIHIPRVPKLTNQGVVEWFEIARLLPKLTSYCYALNVLK